MKLIDAHSHIGNFGSWARFDFDLSRLKAQMAQFNIEKTLLTGASAHDNDAVLHAFEAGTSMSVKIREAYETVGHDRVLFGIDSPFQEPSVEIEKTRATFLPEDALRRIYHDNTAKLLGLPAEETP